MSDNTDVYTRVLRRESHDSRTAPAVVTAAILILLLAGLLILGIWTLVDAKLGDSIAGFLAGENTTLDAVTLSLAAGIILVLLAIVLIWLAVVPGRRDRRSRSTARLAILADNGVLADVVADRIAERCGLDRGNVSVLIGRSASSVHVTPTSGVPLDSAVVADIATGTLAAVGFESNVRVRIAERGVVS